MIEKFSLLSRFLSVKVETIFNPLVTSRICEAMRIPQGAMYGLFEVCRTILKFGTRFAFRANAFFGSVNSRYLFCSD